MQTIILVLQLIIPAAFVLWIFLLPGASWIGLLAQALGTGLVFFVMSRVMLWGVPPRWVLIAAATAWALGLAWAFVDALRTGVPILPSGWTGWSAAIVGLILVPGGLALTLQAIASSKPPESRIIELSSPLGAGAYLVAHGGSRELTNVHLKTLDPSVLRFADWRGQSYAVDILGRTKLGLSRPFSAPSDPAAYPIFGAPVVAPCAGRVIAAEGDLPDMPVPEMDSERKLGNYVILECNGVWVVVAHLRSGGLHVEAGNEVAQGAPLGQVGNSGNTSEPHLHVHAQTPGRPDAPISGDPLPIRINGRYLVRNDILSLR